MSSKVMIIISTAEKAKALTGIMYAVNAQKNKWVDDIKVIFLGLLKIFYAKMRKSSRPLPNYRNMRLRLPANFYPTVTVSATGSKH